MLEKRCSLNEKSIMMSFDDFNNGFCRIFISN